MKRVALLLVCLSVVGCTGAEWKEIGQDAANAAPAAVNDIAMNPSPVGLIIVVGTFIIGLFAKSMARGFGKGVVFVAKKVPGVVPVVPVKAVKKGK